MFYSLSIIFIFIATTVFILLFFEVGYQIGKFYRSHYENKGDTSQGPMVSGILAMLAFMLALTFSMVASRYEIRKQNVLNEAIVINKAYLRADLVAQPYRTEVKRFLREYVDIRLQGVEKTTVERAITRSQELHKLLWTQATLAAEQNTTILTGLMIQSINEIINIHEKRLTAGFRDQIPSNIWLALYAIIAFAMITMGSQTGLAKSRRLIQVIPMTLAFSVVITLIADLDRPAELSQIKVSQEAIIDLQKSMNREKQ